MNQTFRRAVVVGVLAFAAPFAALPLAKPADIAALPVSYTHLYIIVAMKSHI